MILNDVFDFEVDKTQRPNSPLPAGDISINAAALVGLVLMLGGTIIAALASSFSLYVAAALAVAVFLYDGPLKRTPLAPILMGLCRTTNILLGASTAATIPPVVWCYAGAIGIFVAGITWLARRESEKTQSLTQLTPGSISMVSGILLIVYVSWKFASLGDSPHIPQVLPLAIAFISLPILRRLAVAWSTASGAAVQATVITSLRSLIIFDAAMSLLVENGRPVFSIAILCLLGVSWILGRSIRIT